MVEEGHSATIGDARDPFDILAEMEEDGISDSGTNLIGWKVTKP